MEKIIEFKFDPAKNFTLKEERGVGLEDAVAWIKDNRILDIIRHPNKEKYPNQSIYVLEYKNYAYAVPFVINEDEIFLKTIFPDRRLTKKYLRR